MGKTVHHHGKRPSGMGCQIPDLARPPCHRHLETVAQVTRPHRRDRHIHGQDQHLIIGGHRLINQLIHKLNRLIGIELEPGMALGAFDDCLKRG